MRWGFGRSAALATILALLVASPVAASIVKSGNKWCTQNQTPYTRSYTTEWTQSDSPGEAGSNRGIWDNGPNFIVRKVYSDVGEDGGGWTVLVNGGSLNDPGTYGACYTGT
jgi:hypothetical protein